MYHIALILLLLVLCIYLYYKNKIVKVYRFFRPTCMYCRKTQEDWEMFKENCSIMIKCVDINLDEASQNAFYAAMIDNFAIRSVPTIVAVLNNGMRVQYEGSRTVNDLMSWSNQL